MALFYDPNNLFTPIGGSAGGIGVPGFTIYLPTQPSAPSLGNKLTQLSAITSSSSGGIYSPPDSGEVAEIWGHGTLFIGGDTVNTSLSVAGQFGQAAAQVVRAAANPYILGLIAFLVWFFYFRKKR